jgi:pimeloyl-ACP methyl ester carboxylesterase
MAEASTDGTSWGDLEIHVDDAGTGDPVVLLHSSGMSGEQWKRTRDALLAAGSRVVVPDLIGSGRSAPLPEGAPFRFTDDVDVVTRLLSRLGAPAHVIGHSYGGLIALHAALRLSTGPARVRSLAVYDPVAFGVLEPARDADALGDLERVSFAWGASPSEHEAWLRSFVDYWSGEGAWARLRDGVRAEFVRVGWVAHEGARTLVADATRGDAYRALDVPVLLMSGDDSPLAVRRVVARLGENLPRARVAHVAGAGHMGPLTHPRPVNALIAAHLEAASP